jgi:DNA-binding transcriptional regulator YiaG
MTVKIPMEGGHERLIVVDGQHRHASIAEIIVPDYDATAIVGLRTLVHNSVIERTDDDGEVTIEVPKMRELLAAAAVKRCLMPVRLRGSEIKSMRKIMKLTLAELAKRMDERTAVETISRWESEAQPMGGYAEKLLRLLVCEELTKEAPGVSYSASQIARMKVLDPWRVDPSYELSPIELCLIHMKEPSGFVIEAWDARMAA